MCKMASFWHNPNTGEIRVWDLMSHEETAEQLGLNDQYWREGHYLPDGTIKCRVLDTDRATATACNERLRERFPTFWDFLRWAFTQPLHGSLDLRGCTIPEGLRFPESVGGSLDLRGCTLPEGFTVPENLQNRVLT